jgi:hypothetical protein
MRRAAVASHATRKPAASPAPSAEAPRLRRPGRRQGIGRRCAGRRSRRRGSRSACASSRARSRRTGSAGEEPVHRPWRARHVVLHRREDQACLGARVRARLALPVTRCGAFEPLRTGNFRLARVSDQRNVSIAKATVHDRRTNARRRSTTRARSPGTKPAPRCAQTRCGLRSGWTAKAPRRRHRSPTGHTAMPVTPWRHTIGPEGPSSARPAEGGLRRHRRR